MYKKATFCGRTEGRNWKSQSALINVINTGFHKGYEGFEYQ